MRRVDGKSEICRGDPNFAVPHKVANREASSNQLQHINALREHRRQSFAPTVPQLLLLAAFTVTLDFPRPDSAKQVSKLRAPLNSIYASSMLVASWASKGRLVNVTLDFDMKGIACLWPFEVLSEAAL